MGDGKPDGFLCRHFLAGRDFLPIDLGQGVAFTVSQLGQPRRA
jgi:hypothetical protein